MLIHWIWTEDQQIAFILLYALQNQVVQVNHGRKEYSTISLKPGRASSSDGEIQLHVSFVLHCIMLFKIIPHCVHVWAHMFVWCICTCVCTGMLTGARGECQASCSVIHLIPLRQGLSWTWRSVFVFFVVWALQQVLAILLFPHTPPPSPRVTSADVHTQLLMRVQEIWTRVLGLANKRSDPLVEPPLQPHTHAPFEFASYLVFNFFHRFPFCPSKVSYWFFLLWKVETDVYKKYSMIIKISSFPVKWSMSDTLPCRSVCWSTVILTWIHVCFFFFLIPLSFFVEMYPQIKMFLAN